jgi:hypothetical protein
MVLSCPKGAKMTETPKPPSRALLVIWMVLTQLFALGSLLPWVAMAGMSVMAFDSPGSTEMIQPYLFVGAVLCYPALPIGLIIGAWLAFAKQKSVLAFMLSTLSALLPGLAFISLFASDL